MCLGQDSKSRQWLEITVCRWRWRSLCLSRSLPFLHYALVIYKVYRSLVARVASEQGSGLLDGAEDELLDRLLFIMQN
jgi:hypothetical protein